MNMKHWLVATFIGLSWGALGALGAYHLQGADVVSNAPVAPRVQQHVSRQRGSSGVSVEVEVGSADPCYRRDCVSL